MPLASYFIGSRFFGSATVERGSEPLNSLAWFCEGCGEVWGRAVVEGGTWAVEHNRCQACGPAGSWDPRCPGSLLRHPHFTRDYLMPRNYAMALESLPRPLLERELQLALKYAN